MNAKHIVSVLLEGEPDPDPAMSDFVSGSLHGSDPFIGMDKITHGPNGIIIGVTYYRGVHWSLQVVVNYTPSRFGEFQVHVTIDPVKAGRKDLVFDSLWTLQEPSDLAVASQAIETVTDRFKKLVDTMPPVKWNEQDNVRPVGEEIMLHLDDTIGRLGEEDND